MGGVSGVNTIGQNFIGQSDFRPVLPLGLFEDTSNFAVNPNSRITVPLDHFELDSRVETHVDQSGRYNLVDVAEHIHKNSSAILSDEMCSHADLVLGRVNTRLDSSFANNISGRQVLPLQVFDGVSKNSSGEVLDLEVFNVLQGSASRQIIGLDYFDLPKKSSSSWMGWLIKNWQKKSQDFYTNITENFSQFFKEDPKVVIASTLLVAGLVYAAWNTTEIKEIKPISKEQRIYELVLRANLKREKLQKKSKKVKLLAVNTLQNTPKASSKFALQKVSKALTPTHRGLLCPL